MSLPLPSGADLTRILTLGHFSIDSYYGTPITADNENKRGERSRPVEDWEAIYSTEDLIGLELNQIFGDTSSSFQGTAYKNTATGEVIVAFRGTDEGVSKELLSVSIPMGAGISEESTSFDLISTESHIKDAYNFLAQVYDQEGVERSDITLTGHSLGGILAGALGAITNIPAVTFDSGPHNLPVEYFRDDLMLRPEDSALEVDYSVIENFRVDGEVLQASIDAAMAALTFADVWTTISGNIYGKVAIDLLQARFADASRMGDIYEELSAGSLFADSFLSLKDGVGATDAVNLHAMPLLQLILYADQSLGLIRYKDVTSFLKSFFNDDLAERAGYDPERSPSQLMFEDVVLSLLDASSDVLTTSLNFVEDIVSKGMDADFGDLETWEFVIPDFKGPIGRMAEILVEFTGVAARENTILPGAMLQSTTNDGYVSIDLTSFGPSSIIALSDAPYGIEQLYKDLSAQLTNGALSPFEHYFANSERLSIFANEPDYFSIFPRESEIVIGGSAGEIISTGGSRDIIFANSGDDTIFAGDGDDLIIGTDAAGFASDDEINGGAGFDIAVYDELSTSWRITKSGDTFTVDEIGASFGLSTTDTLTNVELLRFSDGYYRFETEEYLTSDRVSFFGDAIFIDGIQVNEVVTSPGQDIAFVIDTTGSMGDDIANVKSSAGEIINAIFNPERGLTDSRIAVVGFNDPTTETILSFTDQANPEDRKAAALDAINSISVFGGGDFPELTYTGLLRALDGSAGEWREDAVARKIVLFGDATAKDTALRDQVIALAKDLNAGFDDETSSSSSARMMMSSVDISEEISLSTFRLAREDGTSVPLPVQIFTVAIGSDSGTVSEFESIAVDTGGEHFRASDASEIVEKLLEVINLPIYAVSLASSSVTEGNSGATIVEVTVERDVATNAADVELLLSGSADDADRSISSSLVSFAAGETSRTLELSINGDTLVEADETIVVSINSVSEAATIGTQSASITVINDDVETPEPEPEPEPQPEPIPEPENRAPTAMDDEIMGRSGWLLEGNIFDDNGNGRDFDPEGDDITLVMIDGENIVFGTPIGLDSGASLVIQSDGSFVYDQRTAHSSASDGVAPDDSFTYTIRDEAGATSEATVEIELGDAPSAPELSLLHAFYQIAFGREADEEGFEFWEGIREGGMSTDDIANFFATSEEFYSSRGNADTTTGFLLNVYENAFDRFPDIEGFNFWASALEGGFVDRGDIVNLFANSQEMQSTYLAEGFSFV